MTQDDESSQLSLFLRTFGGRVLSDVPSNDKKQQTDQKKRNRSHSKSLSTFRDENALETEIFGDEDKSDATQMQLAHMEALIQMKTQQIERLQAEVKTLLRIQNDQAIALEMALQDRRELERQLAQTQTGLPSIGQGFTQVSTEETKLRLNKTNRPGSAHIQTKETPYFLENSMFLRAFLRNDKAALDELVRSISSISDQNTRGLAGQALFAQMQHYMQLNQILERLFDESGTDSFITTFEQNLRNLIDSRRIILWARIPSAKVIVSRSASLVVPEGEGLLGKAVIEGQRLVLTDPSRDPSYSMDYDSPILSNARVSLYQPVVSTKKEVLWIIQIIDRLSSKGTVVTPTGDDFLILDFLSLSLLRLHQEESRIDEMIKRILTESTRSLLTERQVMPLLETVQLTVTHIVGCESLQIFFKEPESNVLFQLCEGTQTNEMNLGSVKREDIPIEKAGIVGVACTSKKVVNVAVAMEHPGYNVDIDGQYRNGSCLAVPLLSSKGVVSLVAVARQKKSGMMFTASDEIILEALSRVSQSALSNAQSHERNIAEIQKALNNHKYYTALLAVAQELSAVLDTDTLVRKVMTKAQSFIGADRCSLFLLDKERGGLWSMVAHGTSDRIHIPEGHGIAGTVAKTGETINISDAYSDPRFNPAVDKSTGYKTKSILCVPIKSNDGTLIGCTQMINKLGTTEFSSTDAELMSAFNVFCGIALSNAQLYEAATKSKKKMTSMLDIALSLSTSPTLDAIMSNIMVRARELIEAEDCYFFIIDRNHHLTRFLGGSDNNINFPIQEDAVGFVALTGVELNIYDFKNEKRFEDRYPKDILVKQMLALPIIDSCGQVTGVAKAINKLNTPRFTEADQSLLRAYASFAGLALDRWMAKCPADFGMLDIEIIETLSPSELTSTEPSDRLRVVDRMASAVSSLRFNVLSYHRNDQYRILLHFFTELQLLRKLNIPVGVCVRFFSGLCSIYRNVPFHDFDHAISVAQILYWMLNQERLFTSFSSIELLALFVASLAHDIGNISAAATNNEKAAYAFSVLYKDQPANQTSYCTSLINLITKPNYNILANIEGDDLKEFWVLVIDLMLCTDSRMYQKIINDANMKVTYKNGADLEVQSLRALALRLLLRTAIYHKAIRPFSINKPWATSLIEEAFNSKEQQLDSLQLAKSQLDAMDKIVSPLVTALVRFIPKLLSISDQFGMNMDEWKNYISQQEKKT